ncbi:DUF971 domain-containing protein [Pseudomaricurvus alkylphenolicus]|jgi:DUF971 family protein|uniref:gamma-butyrobetaine hydroxylase-like domain-containing protein n=1 Tax=Pseudomaricurvus alkylphenolicus TaxID=1306991 RepID=UPI00141E1D35|nr:DUF971 domain-containing protein [Pseudomaricurvus alkylphenolicus]NIB39355.1 DUF971 domain-containing protein [Pseudomaricurvus alkylphenolicus]
MVPSKIKLHKQSRTLEVHFGTEQFVLSAELLRVLSPSAEVRGHGPGQEVLQHGKKNVAISAIEPAGNYAIKIVFDDGHDSGFYSWEYLLELGREKDTLWDDYLQKLHDKQLSRDPDTQVVRLL